MFFEFIFLSVLANFLLSLLLGLFLLKRKYRLRSYIYFNLSIAFWSSCYLIWFFNVGETTFLLSARFLLVSIVLMPYFFLNFCQQFTDVYLPRMFRLLNLALGVVFSFFAFSELMIANIVPIQDFPFWPVAGPFFFAYLLYFFLNVGTAHYLLFKKYKFDQKMIYILIATLIGYLGGVTNFFYWYGIEFPPAGNILVSIYVILLAYAITKHRLMDISVVISRATAWGIATGLYLGSYLLCIYGYRHFWGVSDLAFVGISVVFGVLLANSFQRVRLWIQTTTDKAFLRARYPYTKGLQFYSEAFSRCTDIDAFYTLCETTFPVDFEIRHATVYMPTGYIEQPEFEPVLSSKVGRQITTDSLLYRTGMTTSVILRSEATEVLREELLELDAEAAFVGLENDRVVAILVLGGKLSEDSYMEEDASFLGVLAVQMGVVVTRLRQSRQLTELAVAQRIQTELLPDNISVPGLDLAACMIPASEMGGDFYDLYVSERTHWLMLGDVTGHGVASAMVTFMAQSMLTTLLHQAPDQSPEDLLYDLNTVLSDNMTRLAHVLPIALTVLSTVDGRHFRYAGYHDDMIVIRASGDLQRLSVNQAPFSLGISAFPREMYGCASLFLSPGDLLFIATDGIVESVESGSDEAVFGEERLTDLLQSVAHLSAEAIKSAVLAQLEAFRGKTYLDDVTFWVLKVM